MKSKIWLVGILVFALLGCGRAVGLGQETGPRLIADLIRPYAAVLDNAAVLSNASLHVGDGSPARANHSVLIIGTKIAAVGPSGSFSIPKNARIIDLGGGTVMPGIVGMHNHTHMPGVSLMPYTAPRLYLAGGVTTIQTTGSADALGELKLKAAIDAGNVPGPHIFPTSPYVTGPDGNAVMFKPKTEASARAFVKKWAKLGSTWIKLYRHIDPAMAAIIIDEAHRQGLKVTGHLCSLTYREAAKMGIDSIEHGLNASPDFVASKPYGKCVPSKASKTALDPSGKEVGALINALVDNGVTITSTLAIFETNFPHRPQADARSLKAMSPALVSAYDIRQKRLEERRDSTSSTPQYWQILTQFERNFVAAGGRLVAGPDTGRHILPGYGDQRNFQLLRQSGFTAAQTVQIMTHNGAQTLGIGDMVGLIKQGYRADLIVFSANIDDSPAAIKNPKLVFKDGIGYDPLKLIADVKGQVGLR